MYIIYDDCGNYYDNLRFENLKSFLVDEIIRDGVNRLDEDDNKNRIKECLEELKVLALDNGTTELKYITDQLFQYGWYVQDLQDLHCRLSGFRSYLAYKGVENNTDSVLSLIEKEMINND